MNVIVRPHENVDKSQKRPEISHQERARRKAAVDYARGSVRLEGHILSPFAEAAYSRFIDGELTSEELRAVMLDHYKT